MAERLIEWYEIALRTVVSNIHLVVAVMVGLSIYYIAHSLLDGAQMSSRLKSIANRREELRLRHQSQINKGLRREDGAGGLIQRLVSRLDLQKLAEDPEINRKMLQAGIYGSRPVAIYYFCRIAVPAAAAVGAWIWTQANGSASGATALTISAAAFAGYYVPTLYIKFRITQRQQAIMRVFPDALDMLLVCVESGTTVEQALGYVSDRLMSASPELGAELALTHAEMSYLPERRQAFQNLALRNDHPGVRSVATALVQADRYGTPVGDALRVMARENRELRMLEIERRAAALPAKMTLPMVVFFLPVLFIVVLGPVAVQFIENPPL